MILIMVIHFASLIETYQPMRHVNMLDTETKLRLSPQSSPSSNTCYSIFLLPHIAKVKALQPMRNIHHTPSQPFHADIKSINVHDSSKHVHTPPDNIAETFDDGPPPDADSDQFIDFLAQHNAQPLPPGHLHRLMDSCTPTTDATPNHSSQT